MPVFKLDGSKLTEIKEKKIDLEKNIQKITVENLNLILGYEFIRSEFALNSSRIDTLAFDEENKAFVIIEYKKDQNFSIIDQGYSYLALMLNNKADFVLEYNETRKIGLKRGEVDWSQSKVVFISPSFTSHQRGAMEFKDLPMAMWKVKVYDNSTMLYSEILPSNASESIKTVSKNKTIAEVSAVVKAYSLDDLLKPTSEKSGLLFESLNEKLLALDSRIQPKVNKSYVGYRIGSYNVVQISPQKAKLVVWLVRVDKEELNDRDDKVYKVSWEKNNWGKCCKIDVQTAEDVDYVLYLARQIIDKFYK